MRAVDVDGFSNNALEEYELIVRPGIKAPPCRSRILAEMKQPKHPAVATVPLQALAEDDYGIDSLKLMVDRIQRTSDSKVPCRQPPRPLPSHWEIPLVDHAAAGDSVNWSRIEGTGDQLRFQANYAWDFVAVKGCLPARR